MGDLEHVLKVIDLVLVSGLNCRNFCFHVDLEAANVPFNHIRGYSTELFRYLRLCFNLDLFLRILDLLLGQARLFLLKVALQVGLVIKVHIDALDIFHEVGFFSLLASLGPHHFLDRDGACLLLHYRLFAISTGILQLLAQFGVINHHCAAVIIDFNILPDFFRFFVGAYVSLQPCVIIRINH